MSTIGQIEKLGTKYRNSFLEVWCPPVQYGCTNYLGLQQTKSIFSNERQANWQSNYYTDCSLE